MGGLRKHFKSRRSDLFALPPMDPPKLSLPPIFVVAIFHMLRTHLNRSNLRARFTLALSLATLCPVSAWIGPAQFGSEQALGSEFVIQQNAEPIVKPSDRVVLIGGGWQGDGNRDEGGIEARPQNLVGNMRLAAYAVPALVEARVARVWLGLEAETADALPIIGDVPGVANAYVVGSAHSGYTSGPFMGRIMAQHMLGQTPDLPIFNPARLMGMPMPIA